MRPVHQPTEIVPLIHSAKHDSVADADRHAFGEVDVVCDQYRAAIAQLNNKSLVTRSIVIVS